MIFLLLVFTIFLIRQRSITDRISRVFIWSFFVVWTLQSILSQFGFYDLYIPKDRTIALASINMLFFYLGFRSIKHNWNGYSNNTHTLLSTLGNAVERLINSRFYKILLLSIFFYIVYIFIQFWGAIMMSQNITEARQDNQLTELYGQTYYFLNMLFIYPFSIVTMFLFAYKTFTKRDWMWIVMGLFLLLNSSLKGGRIGFLDVFICVSFVGVSLLNITQGKRGHKSFSNYLIILILGVSLYYVIGLITAGRSGDVSMNSEAFQDNQETTNKHFYTYYVGPIVAFDYAIENDFVARQGGYHYGLLTLSGFEEAFYIVSHKVGINYDRSIERYSRLIQGEYFFIGAMNWNALYTWCNYFYFDFGIIGLMFFPFIFGLLTRMIIRYYYQKPNVYSASLLMYGYLNIVFSVIKYSLNDLKAILLIGFLLYLSNKQTDITRSII